MKLGKLWKPPNNRLTNYLFRRQSKTAAESNDIKYIKDNYKISPVTDFIMHYAMRIDLVGKFQLLIWEKTSPYTTDVSKDNKLPLQIDEVSFL